MLVSSIDEQKRKKQEETKLGGTATYDEVQGLQSQPQSLVLGILQYQN